MNSQIIWKSITRFLIVIAGVIAVTACAHAERRSAHRAANAASTGILIGRIVRGPTSPISAPGIPAPPPPPVAGAQLKVLNLQGTTVATVRSATDGKFQVTLPAGRYRVERGSGLGGGTKNIPAKVTIRAGQQTRLNILIDTGIR